MTAPIHELNTEHLDGVAVLRLSGEIDLSNAGALATAIGEVDGLDVALELSELRYIDSAGIRALDVGYRALGDDGRRLVVVVPPGSPAEFVLRITGLADDLRAESLHEALARLRDGNV